MFLTLFLTFLLGVIIGFLAILTGGAGLLSVPGLMLLGLPPHVAIATNKAGAVVIMIVGGWSFSKVHDVQWRVAIPTTIIATISSFFGARVLLDIPPEYLERLVGAILLILLVVMITFRAQGLERVENLPSWKKWLGYLLFIPVGFWGGFFGGGYALFAAYIFIFLFGLTFLDSCFLKLINGLGIAISSVLVFAAAGIIDWPSVAAIGCGNAIGSYICPRIAVSIGNKWIRVAFIFMVAASAIKFLFF